MTVYEKKINSVTHVLNVMIKKLDSLKVEDKTKAEILDTLFKELMWNFVVDIY